MLRLSVVVVTYKQATMLGRCVASIVEQLGADDELLICDDSSPDETLDVANELARMDARIRVLAAPSNGGVSRNLNRGLDAAQGEFVAIIAGDDAFAPGKVEAQIARMLAEPSCALSYHDVWVMDASLARRERRAVAASGYHPEGRGVGEKLLAFGNAVPGPTAMIRRHLCEGIRFDSRIDMCSDRLYLAQCAQRGTVAYLDQPLALYRRHDGSMTGGFASFLRSYDAQMEMFAIAAASGGFEGWAVEQGRALSQWRLVKEALRHRMPGALANARGPWGRRLGRAALWDMHHRLPRGLASAVRKRADRTRVST